MSAATNGRQKATRAARHTPPTGKVGAARRRAISGLLAVAALLTMPIGAARAACPAGQDLTAALSEATTVFVGEVLTVADHGRTATMHVVAIWKGADLPEQLELFGTADPTAPVHQDDGRYTVGATYLVVPENTRQPFLATKCSATRRHAANGTVIPVAYQEAVGAASGRSPLPSGSLDDGPAGSTAFNSIAAAGVIVVTAGLVARRRKRRQRFARVPMSSWDDDGVGHVDAKPRSRRTHLRVTRKPTSHVVRLSARSEEALRTGRRG